MSSSRKRPERTEIGLGPKDRERRATEAPSPRAKERRRKGNATRPVQSSMISPLATPPPASLYSERKPGSGSYRERKRDSIEIITNRPRSRTTGRFGITKEVVQPSLRPDPRRDADGVATPAHPTPQMQRAPRVHDDDEPVAPPAHPTPQMQRAPRVHDDDEPVAPPAHPTPQMQRAPRGARTEVGIGPRQARSIAERATDRLSDTSAGQSAVDAGPGPATARDRSSTPPARPSVERTAIGFGPGAATPRDRASTPPARPSAERTAIGVGPEPAATRKHIIELIERLGDEDEATRRAASQELGRLTGVHYGFVAEAPKRERDTAQRRYRDWWLTEGRQRFA